MSKAMSKSQIIAHLAKESGAPRKTVALFFDELFKLAVKEAKGGAGEFVIPKIGRMVKARGRARTGRSPRSGETIKIRARTVIRFRPSGIFKGAVTGGTDDPGPHIRKTAIRAHRT
jgi:DNA-binding protein HU-beta